MPTFLDHHPIAHAPLTSQATEALTTQIRAAEPDDYGVKLLNAFVAVNGEGYCISEAPSADAVVQSHAALGYLIDAEEVVEVTSLA